MSTTSSPPYELAPEEGVTRFIYSKNNYSSQRGRPKPNAFDPSPYVSLSVAHTTGLPDEEVWKIGEATLGTTQGRTKIYARADVTVSVLNVQKLKAIRDDNPFIRHTSLSGWPELVDKNEQKERWKLMCLELSESDGVQLVLPSAPITGTTA